MENQLITIEELEVGDEIVIACQSYMKYLKVLEKPRLSKTRVHWNTTTPMYKNVKCSTRQDVVTNTYTWNGKSYTNSQKTWRVTPEDHNITISQDLNDRGIWLVKRENNN